MTDVQARISFSGVSIRKKDFLPNEIEVLKQVLTVEPMQIGDYGPTLFSKYPVYRENGFRISFPKFFGLDWLKSLKVSTVNFVDKQRDGESIELSFEGSLRSKQKKPARKILKHLKEFGGGVAACHTGFGKTCVGLWLISQLERKTLIVVHKEFLLDQWISRIEQFLPSARVGRIQRDKVDVENKHVVIAMLQSISMKDYDLKIFKDFGFVIVDECHRIPTKTFSKALFKIPTKYMLGLSATPKRADGLDKVIHWFLGPLILEVKRSEGSPVIQCVYAVYENDITPKQNYRGHLNLPDLINQLCADPARNYQIVDCVIQKLKEGRKILVLSDRRNHCEVLCSQLEKSCGENWTFGVYLGGMKKEALDATNECDVILATYSMAKEGYDCPDLNTLVFATGKSDVEQAIGRILRKKHDMVPVIIDMVDGLLLNQFRKRKTLYNKQAVSIDLPQQLKPRSNKKKKGLRIVD